MRKETHDEHPNKRSLHSRSRKNNSSNFKFIERLRQLFRRSDETEEYSRSNEDSSFDESDYAEINEISNPLIKDINFAERMTWYQYKDLRNIQKGFIIGPRNIKIGSIQEDLNGKCILVCGRTGEYFFDGEVNVEWYTVKQLVSRDIYWSDIPEP